MKNKVLIPGIFLVMMAGCSHREGVTGVYRYWAGKRGAFDVWIVDGSLVRRDIYTEFLYGGNEQRYCFTPPGEIWIDNAISCEEYELTVAHELNERHLMAKFGWTYDRAHDSSLAVEQVIRHGNDSLCRLHEQQLPAVSPTDWSGRKELSRLPDSILLKGIYRVPVGQREGLNVWIVDGYLVRKNIFPDFGFSGNDLSCRFIPKGEVWIDGQVSCEETEYSIAGELLERKLMLGGMPFSDAYESSVAVIRDLRDKMAGRIRNHPPVLLPDTTARDAGVADPAER